MMKEHLPYSPLPSLSKLERKKVASFNSSPLPNTHTHTHSLNWTWHRTLITCGCWPWPPNALKRTLHGHSWSWPLSGSPWLSSTGLTLVVLLGASTIPSITGKSPLQPQPTTTLTFPRILLTKSFPVPKASLSSGASTSWSPSRTTVSQLLPRHATLRGSWPSASATHVPSSRATPMSLRRFSPALFSLIVQSRNLHTASCSTAPSVSPHMASTGVPSAVSPPRTSSALSKSRPPSSSAPKSPPKWPVPSRTAMVAFRFARFWRKLLWTTWCGRSLDKYTSWMRRTQKWRSFPSWWNRGTIYWVPSIGVTISLFSKTLTFRKSGSLVQNSSPKWTGSLVQSSPTMKPT